MHIKIKILSSDEVFIGLRFAITKMVTDIRSYSPDIEYPKAYTLDIGLLFGSIELTYKGSH